MKDFWSTVYNLTTNSQFLFLTKHGAVYSAELYD